MRGDRVRLIVVLLVLAGALLAIFWPSKGGWISNIRLGLDIKGGARIEYMVEVQQGTENPSDVVDDVWTVLRNRLDAAGYTEAAVKKVLRDNKYYIVVEIPGATDTVQAEKLIGSTGVLYFAQVLDEYLGEDPSKVPELSLEARRENAVWLKGRDGKWYLVKKEIMGRKDLVLEAPRIVYARPEVETRTGRYGYKVSFELAKEYVDIFKKITQALYVPEGTYDPKKRLAIVLDDVVQFVGQVVAIITDGKAEITGNFSLEEAKQLAAILRSGALPARLVKTSSGWVAPLLGRDVIDASLKAGIIGLILVLVYMIIYYRTMGIVADLALIYNTVLLLGVMAAGKFILTLPGIAGIILTIGTTVDGNVIIYERIKEEMRLGKPVKTSIAAGFDRSLSTILDANITTILTGLILYYFGTGTIKGFAITLIIGVLGSIFVNLVFSRLLLDALARFIKPLRADEAQGGTGQ
ncbi:preprotein translocase subunit SecD [Thermotoga maritima MSB8]|uniref:Protein translocase subunit SecD n=1 Tax=Thermotoga maritima (strain ATCC 43589 / DSM 3109 / JCM 10099 / NBRC 100826 / MSB8) TaxID=243274 RepID=Q9WZW4_THEMA|nr:MULTISPECIES: protein translocase subunit SecD [Thermotoga]AAD35942.1 protein-export membrane protein SecD, putative [Thermotoga maritima MSB8]ACB08429.1 protein-export membrane protein SecD [Thermotoga sp. RQ2]AGL49787.1 Protein-export membrane protein SecD [Thermotoga maritima MSB8]AHD17387.1 preprotein translocase subunit SecD [Thermotoga maritima MSB8]AIY85619.1 protein-export membrane protein SecD [Thermotoga sp. 2812B]